MLAAATEIRRSWLSASPIEKIDTSSILLKQLLTLSAICVATIFVLGFAAQQRLSKSLRCLIVTFAGVGASNGSTTASTNTGRPTLAERARSWIAAFFGIVDAEANGAAGFGKISQNLSAQDLRRTQDSRERPSAPT
jgi:hypothetical protein